eukprot:scaffold427_cov344-Prasinococcus_capsulatus_cf.AAC.5
MYVRLLDAARRARGGDGGAGPRPAQLWCPHSRPPRRAPLAFLRRPPGASSGAAPRSTRARPEELGVVVGGGARPAHSNRRRRGHEDPDSPTRRPLPGAGGERVRYAKACTGSPEVVAATTPRGPPQQRRTHPPRQQRSSVRAATWRAAARRRVPQHRSRTSAAARAGARPRLGSHWLPPPLRGKRARAARRGRCYARGNASRQYCALPQLWTAVRMFAHPCSEQHNAPRHKVAPHASIGPHNCTSAGLHPPLPRRCACSCAVPPSHWPIADVALGDHVR